MSLKADWDMTVVRKCGNIGSEERTEYNKSIKTGECVLQLETWSYCFFPIVLVNTHLRL